MAQSLVAQPADPSEPVKHKRWFAFDGKQKMARYVAYFRVSTEKQGKSGLGLAAQHSLIERFLPDNDEVIAEYVEVQSGKNDERLELWKAINHAKRNDAKLLIAKLDRFSRKVSFIASIMEQGIGLVVAEMPNATDFQLHIFAALAQEERRLISERTRNALAEAKKRGVQLGKNGKLLAERNRKAADERAETLRPMIMPMVDAGLSLSEIARRLNGMGIATVRGGRFYPEHVSLLMARFRRRLSR
ncbi:recombinase family protein [Novosphingobium sp.]|uniref:recombinase family protein n=1 Tax=Novosphingobium sp. TaxID=1874826 RepID=UPI0022C104B5|nr:recombinase family protein [Novosphingobium sp.]MCZ8018674.1 recombinase family protein [Novosphingobium sp.]MCZ8034679.1 recombinase family protein [Novosphingobium sp.]MCZ8052814.1 recombinase family protein [Novosphingobium sp.]MCZ8060572.1 recombinase family protein [Novosphingobium sp.]MCZ8230598.1 recombinase family protein [Novosphingobium sp.]